MRSKFTKEDIAIEFIANKLYKRYCDGNFLRKKILRSNLQKTNFAKKDITIKIIFAKKVSRI